MMFENLDFEGKCIVYQFVVMSAFLMSFLFLHESGLLNQLTMVFICVFYGVLLFSGGSILKSNLQKQAPLEQNQLPDIQKD